MKRAALFLALALLGCPAAKEAPAKVGPKTARMYPPDAGLTADGGNARVLAPGSMLPVVGDGPRVFVGHTESLLVVAFSPDGRLLASGGLDQTVRVWDLQKNVQRAQLTGINTDVSALAFSADGSALLVGDRQFSIHFFDTATFTEQKNLVHSEFVSGLQLSRDGTLLAVAGATGGGELVTLPDGKRRCEFRGRSVNFAAKDTRVVAALMSGAIAVIDPETCKQLYDVKTEPHLPFTVTAGDLNTVLSWNGDSPIVRVWDLVKKKQVGQLEGHREGVTSVVMSADGSRALSASSDATMRLWDVPSRKLLHTYQLRRLGFGAITADGTKVAAVSGTEVSVWEVQP